MLNTDPHYCFKSCSYILLLLLPLQYSSKNCSNQPVIQVADFDLYSSGWKTTPSCSSANANSLRNEHYFLSVHLGAKAEETEKFCQSIHSCCAVSDNNNNSLEGSTRLQLDGNST